MLSINTWKLRFDKRNEWKLLSGFQQFNHRRNWRMGLKRWRSRRESIIETPNQINIEKVEQLKKSQKTFKKSHTHTRRNRRQPEQLEDVQVISSARIQSDKRFVLILSKDYLQREFRTKFLQNVTPTQYLMCANHKDFVYSIEFSKESFESFPQNRPRLLLLYNIFSEIVNNLKVNLK